MRPAIAAVRNEINVTPLVDVCLVLLIIFMVVTPILRQADVELAPTSRPTPLAEKPDQLVLSLRADGLRLGGLPITPVEAADLIRARGLEGRGVVIRADRRLEYRQLRELLATLSEAGLAGAALETTRVEPEP